MRALSRRQALGVVVALGAVSCVGVAVVRPAPPAEAQGTIEPVARSVAVCARPTTSGSTTSALGLVAATAEQAVGQAVLSDLPTGQKTLLSIDGPASRAALTVPKSSRTVPAVQHTEGTLAPLVTAGQVSLTTEGSGSGLAAVTCAAPTGESWFVGGGATVGRRTTVFLSNPDSTQAVVDLEVFGPDGPVVGHGTDGVVVPPHRQTAVRLDVAVPGTARTAVHVVARAGRVSVAMQDVDTKGLIPRGADYVPLAAGPSTHVVVPGLLAGTSGRRLLQVVAPGDADAIVNVRVVAADGTFTPEAANVLEVPAGSVAQVDLVKALGTGSVALVLDSDVPVVAGMRTVLPRADEAAESTYSAGVAALTGPAAFAPLVVGSADVPVVVLTAADAAAAATVTVLGTDGTPTEQRVQVPAGTTVTVPLSGARTGAAVVVTPTDGSGPLHAALQLVRTLSSGAVRSTVPLTSNPATISVPGVAPDPAIGVPGR